MNATEKKIAVLLAGTGVIPISEECLKEIFVDNHSMFTEESKEGESEVNFMNRAFCKALRKESIVNSTKQCMIINAPVGHGKMSSEEIGLLSTYINRWTNNAEHYSMNWGLYEIPNTTKMRITILASSPTQPQAEENETQDVKKNVTEKPRRWRAWEVMLGLFGLLFMMYAYNFFFGENGYRRQKQEAFKIEYGEKRMLWRMSENMTEQQMLTDMTLLANGDTALVCWICNIPLKVYREFVNGTAQPTRSTWVLTRFWYHMALVNGREWMQDSADELKSKAFIFWDKTDRLIQNDTLKDYRKEKLTDMEIKLNKTYPAKGKPSEKEFEEWKEEHSERRWLTLPGMS